MQVRWNKVNGQAGNEDDIYLFFAQWSVTLKSTRNSTMSLLKFVCSFRDGEQPSYNELPLAWHLITKSHPTLPSGNRWIDINIFEKIDRFIRCTGLFRTRRYHRYRSVCYLPLDNQCCSFVWISGKELVCFCIFGLCDGIGVDGQEFHASTSI